MGDEDRMTQDLDELARSLGELLKQRSMMLATAESCTGGWVGQVVTSIPGSSHWYDRGFITYTNQAKRDMLGVSTDILARHGAVSAQTVRAMAEGALAHSRAQAALAITGIAGPGGGSEDKPVGTVWLGWAASGRDPVVVMERFDGDRQEIRRQAVARALRGMLEFLETDRS
jgi:nicotinamide-nucleotide amidase